MIWRRLWYLARRSKLERELAEEMEAHREQMGHASGFGNTLRLREEAADVWGWRWFDELLQDARHGLRVLGRMPAFTLTAIVVLALGTGLNLALYHLLNAALLTPPRIREPETMVRLSHSARGFSSSGVAFPVAGYIKDNTEVFDAVLVVQNARCPWGDEYERQVDVTFVSSNFFEETGAAAVHGRVLHEGEDDRPGAAPVVVVSYEFWQSRLGGDPRVPGAVVKLNGRQTTIAGIAPAGFTGPRNRSTQIWAPIEQLAHYYPGTKIHQDWGSYNIDMYARLKPGVTEAAVRDALRAPVAELRKMHPKEMGEEPQLNLASGMRHFRRENDDREMRMLVPILVGFCLLILVIACANLAGLSVAHVSARTREVQMRTVLGASRFRIVRQLLTESMLLVFAGTVGGWFVGYLVAKMLAEQTDAPFPITLTPDWRMALGTCVLGAVALMLVGLLPALRIASHQRLVADRAPRTRLQRSLIGVQVMGACVLLLIAGMMTRKLQSVTSSNLGFSVEQVAVMEVALSRYGMPSSSASAYWRSVKESVMADPRVEGAALTTIAPLGNTVATSRYNDAPGLQVMTMTVDASFLPLLRIPLLAGRNFLPGDTRATAVIISRRLAERMYGTANVVGQSFPKTGEGTRATIVGVTADAKLMNVAAVNAAEQYSPMEANDLGNGILLARTTGGLEVLRGAAQKVNPAITPGLRWMRADLDRKLEAPRLTSLATSGVGLLALALTAIGIFGLVAYSVSLRRKEIGIRVALGARSGRVLGVLVHGLLWPVTLGVAIGAGVVLLGLAKPLSGSPFYADPNDPLGIAAALLLLLGVGLLAGITPAMRALRIDPAVTLREQ